MSRWTHCGGVEKILLANLAIILVCAAWLMLAGCGGGIRIEFPPKTEVHPVETIGEVAAVAASMAKAPASSDTSSDPWKSQAIWAGSVLALAYPFGRLIRTRLLNPTKPE